jgi:hypothetical protein
MPIIFHVYLNGKRVSTAGVGELGVLGAHVSWVRRQGKDTRSKGPEATEEELRLNVGGLITPTEEHVRWVDKTLKIGDEVRIVIAADEPTVDPPRSRERRDLVKERQQKKEYVKNMAKEFGWKIQTK